MFAHLFQEFAIGAAEGLSLPSRRDHHTEHVAFHQQRRDHQRSQTHAGESLRKRMLHLTRIGFVDQLALHTARQPVTVDREPRAFRQSQFEGRWLAARPDTVHGHEIRRSRVQTDAAEIDRQLILQRTEQHCENAAQVLPLPDRAGDVLQQIQPLELAS